MSSPTPYQLLPRLSEDEYTALRDDIAANGIRVPVDVDEQGTVLDGHHRSWIAADLGIDCPKRVVLGLSDEDKRAHAVAVNVHRRSLTREQRRELVARLVKADPQVSDRTHAERAGVDHKTVGSVRRDLVERGEVPHADTRADSLGRQQPASKPAKVTHTTRTTEATKVEHEIDQATGEILTEPDPIEAAIAKYPDLDAYRDQPDRIVALAASLDGYPEGERAVRLDALGKHAAAKREGRLPGKHEHDDLGDRVFEAANALARLVQGREGDIPALADNVTRGLWHDQFRRTSQILTDLADQLAAPPTLRSIQ